MADRRPMAGFLRRFWVRFGSVQGHGRVRLGYPRAWKKSQGQGASAGNKRKAPEGRTGTGIAGSAPEVGLKSCSSAGRDFWLAPMAEIFMCTPMADSLARDPSAESGGGSFWAAEMRLCGSGSGGCQVPEGGFRGRCGSWEGAQGGVWMLLGSRRGWMAGSGGEMRSLVQLVRR